MLPALLLALGVSLLSYVFLSTISKLWRKKPVVSFQISPFLLGGIGLAILARDLILSPWFLGLGLFLSLWERRRKKREKVKETIEQAIALVQGIQNYMFGALGPALKDAAEALPQGEVKTRALLAWHRYATGTFWDEALSCLFGLNPVLDRLGHILRAAPNMSAERVKEALQKLAQEYSKVMQLKAETGVELILVSLTVRFMLLANLAACVFTLLFPAWREFYISSFAHRGAMLAANILAVAAYIYYQEELTSMEEVV